MGGWWEGTGKGAAPAILRDGMNGLSSTAPDTYNILTKRIFKESVNQRMNLRLPAEVNLIDDDNPCRLLTYNHWLLTFGKLLVLVEHSSAFFFFFFDWVG